MISAMIAMVRVVIETFPFVVWGASRRRPTFASIIPPSLNTTRSRPSKRWRLSRNAEAGLRHRRRLEGPDLEAAVVLEWTLVLRSELAGWAVRAGLRSRAPASMPVASEPRGQRRVLPFAVGIRLSAGAGMPWIEDAHGPKLALACGARERASSPRRRRSADMPPDPPCGKPMAPPHSNGLTINAAVARQWRPAARVPAGGGGRLTEPCNFRTFGRSFPAYPHCRSRPLFQTTQPRAGRTAAPAFRGKRLAGRGTYGRCCWQAIAIARPAAGRP
jgi:hypothetical protein